MLFLLLHKLIGIVSEKMERQSLVMDIRTEKEDLILLIFYNKIIDIMV